MTDLPVPPLPSTVDLRNYPGMMVQVARVRDSEFRRRANAEAFRAGVLLWFAAWHQIPAGSLPNDDMALADLACLGMGKAAVREWEKLRPMALRGWYPCADGRLYHPVMVEAATAAWESKLAQKARTMKARLASLGKLIAKEANPRQKLSLQRDYDRLIEEINEAELRASATTPVTGGPTGVPTASKGREENGREGSGGSAPEALPPTPPGDVPEADRGDIPGAHLAETLDALGAPSHHAEALGQWHAFLTGPLVGAASEDEQHRALRWLIRRAQVDGKPAQYARHVQAYAPAWREFNAARKRAPEPAKAPEKSMDEIQAEHRARRLSGRLDDWERNAIATGRNHVGPDGSLRKGPAPVDPPPEGQEPTP